MNDKPLICTQCGGTIDRDRMVCPFCGTQYKRGSITHELKVVKVGANIKTYRARMTVGNYELAHIPIDYLKRRIVEQFLNAIADDIVIKMEEDFARDSKIFSSTLRLIDSKLFY